MFIITKKGKSDDGAYSVLDEVQEKILYIFEQQDDALRYSMQLEDMGFPPMEVLEVEDELMIKTCEMHDRKYAIITADDFVIPPHSDIPHDYV